MASSIWWIRRDLRLEDNPALQAALSGGRQVIPVFVLDPRLVTSPYNSPRRLFFLLEGLKSLDAQLRARGSYLVFREGLPHQVLEELLTTTSAGRIFAELDHSPYARRRDAKIQSTLPLTLVSSPAVLAPGTVLKPDGNPYTVYTPFSKTWKSRYPAHTAPPLPAPSRVSTPAGISTQPIQSTASAPHATFIPAGSESAQTLLESFLHPEHGRVLAYHTARDRVDLGGTSRLSPYLRFGMLSARAVMFAVERERLRPGPQAAVTGINTWINELIWRDFYFHILHHFPRVRQGNFRLGKIPWANNEAEFDAWKHGQTGYPIVDAAMRQLLESGWMHNRARMITASFLTKDLLIDWQWGERWFMQQLIDGDPAANNGGWQWSAGTGTDAAPYFRIFNPITQSKKFDPQGKYIRRWIPELQAVPQEFIHEPWKMPAALQDRSGCKIGSDYPGPMIDHRWARQRTLAAYAEAK